MISMLLNDTIPLPAPKRPAFFTGRDKSFSTLDQIKPEDCSKDLSTSYNIEMISMLLNDTIILPTALLQKDSILFTGRIESKSTLDNIKSEDCFVNNMTIIVMEGR
ncbi:hypothetical protein L1987_02731 [Smallanthus sonchifolius]|uniref:Uncharacterized protein n=1 Tax=Smallanthus sonchifolius TaxID=185202 RepID=A0ACB9K8S4_9ASTR|nr:hypothetical protein L1987_02731 [Smallanthus sonchifolius]